MLPNPSKTDTYALCVDKLILQLRHNAPGFDLHHLPAGNFTVGSTCFELASENDIRNNYQRNYFVTVSGEKIGFISLDSFRVVNANLICFTVCNRALYGAYVGLIATFFEECKLMVNNIKILEIALDTNTNLIARFRRYFKNPTAYHALFKMQAEGVGVAGNVYRQGSAALTYYPYFSDERKMRLYDKTTEIEENSKQYITNWHLANGLDTNKKIYRIEIILNNDSFKKRGNGYTRLDKETGELENISKYKFELLSEADRATWELTPSPGEDFTPNIFSLNEPEYLQSILNKYTNGLHLFSERDNIVKTRCTPLPLLTLGKAPALVPVAVAASQKTETKNMINSLRIAVQQYYRTNNPAYLSYARLLAADTNTTGELEKQLTRLLPLRPVLRKAAQKTNLYCNFSL